MIESRPWGSFEVILHDTKSKPQSWIKWLSINSGSSLSLQRHSGRHEIWFVESGEGEAIVGTERRKITAGSIVSVPAGTIHRITSKTNMRILEIAFGDDVREEDIERLEDRYGRIK